MVIPLKYKTFLVKMYVLRSKFSFVFKPKVMKFRDITVSFALLTMFGCQNIFEDNDVTLDGSTPFNTVSSPGANNVYNAKDGLKLETSFVDKDQVAEVDVKIVALGSDFRAGASVIDFKRKPNLTQYKLDTMFAANTFAPGNYQLTIRSVDTRNNVGVQEVKFAVQ